MNTSIRSFTFLADLFVAGFDAADCWEELMENWNVWNEEYENPEDPREIPGDLKREASEIALQRYGSPTSVASAYAHQRRVHGIAQELMMRDEIDELINKARWRHRSPGDPDSKVQIVARYLSQVL